MSNLKRYTLYIMNLLDILSLLVSFGLAVGIRTRISPYHPYMDVHQKLLLVFLIAYVITNVVSLYNDEDFLHRSSFGEFLASLKMVGYVGVITIIYMYFAKVSFYFSRMLVGIFLGVFLLIDFIGRCFVKNLILPHYQNSKMSDKIVIAGDEEYVAKVLENFSRSVDWRFSVAGVVLKGSYAKGDRFEGTEVLCNMDELEQELQKMPVDSVLLAVDEKGERLANRIRMIEKNGKVANVYIKEFDIVKAYKKLDQLGDSAVISFHEVMPMPKRLALMKRAIDIAVSIMLLPVVALTALITFIFNVFDSHGPLFIHKVRIGKNGIRFYQLRFRTYRIDAEDRMARGESGLTMVGRVLRFLHLDGLPSVLNVISGEMSLIGPRPLAVPEIVSAKGVRKYTAEARPGILGNWSMEKNGYNKTDDEYVSEWTPVKDLIIVIVHFIKYVTFHSCRVVTKEHIHEELEEIAEYRREKNPLPYSRSLYKKEMTAGHKAFLIVKRVADIVLSLCGIIVLSPVLLLLTILVIADDGGSPFYGHKRIGENGRRIKIYKFRSMRVDAGDLEKLLTPEQLEQYHNEFKIDNDPRITKIGSFIRKTSLDELPQLFNILFGTLSVIGPRPIVEEETKIYGDEIGRLLSVKPGLTGYWQAYARNNATYESGERQKMEMYYVDHQSLILDIKIFFKTFAAVLKKEGAQ